MSTTEHTLDYIIYGKLGDAPTQSEYGVLARSAGITSQDAMLWRGLISVQPPKLAAPDDQDQSRAVGIFKGPEGANILALAFPYKENAPVFQYVLLPRTLLQRVFGNINALLTQTERPLPVTPQSDPLTPLTLNGSLNFDTEALRLSRLRDLPPLFETITDLFPLLAAALDERKLAICGYPTGLNNRLHLVEALAMLLPETVRPELSFSTHVDDLASARGRIVFCDDLEQAETTERWLWSTEASFLADDRLNIPYVQYLENIWPYDDENLSDDQEPENPGDETNITQQDTKVAIGQLEIAVTQFVAQLQTTESEIESTTSSATLQADLDRFARRYFLNSSVRSNNDISVEELKEAFETGSTPTSALRLRYAERLLEHCLEDRDADTVALLFQYMEADPELNDTIMQALHNALDEQPDAVYFFVRTRLGGEVDADWMPLLHNSAKAALKLANEDSDEETLITWLKLIMREPASYDLEDVLKNGIAAAQLRAHDDSALASRLMLLVARREPELIDLLLADKTLIEALSDPLGGALRDYNPDLIDKLIEAERHDIVTVILSRAARSITVSGQFSALFTSTRISYLLSQDAAGTLPPEYHPATVLDMLLNDHLQHLNTDALQTLLSQVILNNDGGNRARLWSLVQQLAEQGALFELLLDVYRRNALPVDKVLELTEAMLSDEILTNQQTVDIYCRIASNRNWEESTLLLIEQVARSIQQNPALILSIDTLWRMLSLANTAGTELIARVTARRILAHAATQDDKSELTTALIALREQLQWSPTTLTLVVGWWREFVQQQSLVHLQQLDSALASQKALSEERATVQTTIAFRKMLGTQSPSAFADAVGTSFKLLEAIADSFDPAPTAFDPGAIRTEIDKLTSDLSPDERRVLAKNLKELAQLVITMSENRSKANLIRREEEIERQLITGEQQPQSAVDTMKWLSGYLNGTQADEN